ncbi:helix-turn-helix transcriptional regulator [Marisediminicola senii]|uniref:helix-turn-helix transcriptional regulator n=1 Tax=Marisediminicola senii TaxID=2711233 RepID=UPI0013EDADBB|nr:LuxR family transcriptional regulator [Marisediminicola senii]
MDLVARRDAVDRIAKLETTGAESALIVVGESGAGKSALLDTTRDASAIEAVLLRSIPTESAWPLTGFSRVLESLTDSRASDFITRFAPGTDAASMLQTAHDLLAFLRGLDLAPVLVLIDDIDVMDIESQTVLGFISGRLAGTGVRIVATASRVDADGPLSAFPRVGLRSLTESEAFEIASQVAGPASDAGILRVVTAHARGNPGTLVDIVDGLSDNERRGDDAVVLPFRPAPTMHSIADARVAALPVRERAMLDRMSLAPLSRASALGRRGSDDADAIEDLLYSGLVVTVGQHVRLADPILRSVLFWGMESRTRRALHAELAAAHAETDPRLHLWHRSFIDDDAPSAGLMDAAICFAQQADTTTAVEFAERALRIAPVIAEHHSLIVELANALYLRAELDLAARYVSFARRESTAATPDLRLATIMTSIQFARTQVVSDDEVDASISLYSGGDPGGAVDLRALAATFHAERWEVDRARDHLAHARAQAGSIDEADRARLDSAQLLIAAIDGTAPVPETTADLDDSAVVAMPARAMIELGRTLSLRERYVDARRVFTIALNQPMTPEPILAESARFFLAVNEVRAGDLRRAQAAAGDWFDHQPRGLPPRASRMLLHAWSMHSAGDTEESMPLFERCLEQSSLERNQAVAAQVIAFQGTRALMDEAPAEAVRLLEFADVLGAHFRNPALVRHSADLVEAYVSSKRIREAHGVLRSMHEARAVRPSRWLTLAIARAEGLVAPDDAPVRLFQDAVDLYGPADSQYELGRLLTNLAKAQERFGLARDGEGSLAAARSAFERAGALSWAASSGRVLESPADAGAAAILHLLTEEERLVAEKVCQGYRNKEIAAALYISLRTVELRLTRIYRKVGARSRSHLVAFLN